MSQITMTPADAMITLENVNKWYGQFHVLKDINLKVKQGERIVLCGPSGSGKSTTIRCINHLEEHQQGRIVVDGIELNEDIRKKVYSNLDKLSLQDLENYHDKELRNQPFSYSVIASEKRIHVDDLKKYGQVTKLNTEQLFGYSKDVSKVF